MRGAWSGVFVMASLFASGCGDSVYDRTKCWNYIFKAEGVTELVACSETTSPEDQHVTADCQARAARLLADRIDTLECNGDPAAPTFTIVCGSWPGGVVRLPASEGYNGCVTRIITDQIPQRASEVLISPMITCEEEGCWTD